MWYASIFCMTRNEESKILVDVSDPNWMDGILAFEIKSLLPHNRTLPNFAVVLHYINGVELQSLRRIGPAEAANTIF